MSHAFGSLAPTSAADGEKLDNIVLDEETEKEYKSIALKLTIATSIHLVALLLPSVAYPIITLYLVGQDVSKASEVTGWIFMVNAAVLLVGSIVVGMLADKFSRKVVIVTTMAINVVFYFLQSTFTVFWMALPFYLSRAFIPCSSRFYAFLSDSLELRVVRAYISDVTVNELDRISRFARLDAVFGIAIAVGPTVGGLLCLVDLITPICLSNILMAGVCFFYMFGLPRVDREKQIRANGVVGKRETSTFKDMISLFRFLLRDKLSLLALVLYFLGTIGSQDVMDILLFYVKFRTGWESGWQLGLVALCTGVSTLLFQAFAAPWLLSKFTKQKVWLMAICCLVTALGHCLLAISTTPVMILLVLPLAAVFRLVTSYLASLVAERVPTRFTAAAMGLLGSMEPLAQLIGAPIVTGLLEEFTKPEKEYHWVLPGSPFFFGASTYIIQAIVLVTIFRVYLNAAEAPGAPNPSKIVDEEATLLSGTSQGAPKKNPETPVL